MFRCHVCGSTESRVETVSEVFNIDSHSNSIHPDWHLQRQHQIVTVNHVRLTRPEWHSVLLPKNWTRNWRFLLNT